MSYLKPLTVKCLFPLSVTETVSVSSSYGGGGDDEDHALLDRMAKREERRQRRMKEALDRQRQLDPAATEGNDSITMEKNNEEEERPSWRRGRYRESEEAEEKALTYSSRREEKERVETREEDEAAPEGREEAEEGVDEEEEQKVEVVEDKPRRSYLKEQVSRLSLLFCILAVFWILAAHSLLKCDACFCRNQLKSPKCKTRYGHWFIDFVKHNWALLSTTWYNPFS